ncbi:alpha-2-macroglobulin-like [Mantella aurantiaca]
MKNSCKMEVSMTGRHYAVIFPSELRPDHPEMVCIHLEGAQGESRVEISLNLENETTTLTEKTFQDSTFTCTQLQVPYSKQRDKEVVGTLVAVIENAGEIIRNSTKVLLKSVKFRFLIQTDKAVYKPSQTVHFRILAINEYYKPENRTDPKKNRIGQWLNVNVSQGIAEFSFPLSSEPPLGEYSINVMNRFQTFTVEEYVLPKFDVSLLLPKNVRIDSESFNFQICGTYTYGKPVQGQYSVTVCRSYLRWSLRGTDEKSDICNVFTGELDTSGCRTVEVKTEDYKLNRTGLSRALKAEAFITEQGTEIQLSTSSQTTVSSLVSKLSFLDADTNYKAGIPYKAVVKVMDAQDNPRQDIKVFLQRKNGTEITLIDTSVTDDNGKAVFIVNTTNWEGTKYLMPITTFFRSNKKLDRGSNTPTFYQENELGMAVMHTQDVASRVPAKTVLETSKSVPDFILLEYRQGHLTLQPSYSKGKSILKLHSLDTVLPCGGKQDVEVEYIFKHTELKENYEHLDLHYLVTYMGSIVDSGSLEINVKNENEDIHGKATFTLSVNAVQSSTLRALVYILLPDGEILADSAKYNVQKCFKNKVSLGFSPDEVLPGSDVSIKVQAAPGSLCGLRVVDKSVVLMKPDKELTPDKVFNLFSYWESQNYDHRIQDYDNSCGFSDFGLPPLFLWHEMFFVQKDVDVNTIFMGLRLKIFTSAEIKKPVICSQISQIPLKRDRNERGRTMNPTFTSVDMARTVKLVKEEKVRIHFPETFLFELTALGMDGSAELNKKAPDTITDWQGGAVCLGPGGFGLSTTASLTVFQPFFVDLTLPYSVVRGEIFTLKASTFNYMKQPMKVKATLYISSDLEEMPCEDCQHSSCLGADESKTFFWKLKAKVLGQVNITVKTEALDTKELCKNEIPIVPKQGSTDTIVKTLLVQPGGILVEKSFSSLMCIQEGKDNSKTEEVALQVPVKILENSERAHISVLGDLMGTAMQNLDRLLAMPYGCGEQNMVLFAPNIFILQYLEKTHQLTDEIKSKATKFLQSGLQRQWTYKRNDGSYSAFGQSDPQGNTWLTGFVLKSYSQSRPYIFIDEDKLRSSFNWLKNNRNESGCFHSVGRLFNNAMKGGVEDDISLSAYVTIALLEYGLTIEDGVVKNAVTCLRKAAVNVNNVYTMALLAYTFTLCGDNELRTDLLKKLEEKAVIGDGQIHWKRDSTPPKQGAHWYRAPSAEVEMTSYVLLALLSGPEPDLGRAAEIVNWISKQQNPYGGFSSTQDTVVALQALSKYAEITYSEKGDISVTVTSTTGFLEKFHVDNNNRLLLQRTTLPAIPGEYAVTATGTGCVFVQTVLRYNIPPPKTEAVFSLTVKTSSKVECLGEPVKTFKIEIVAAYTGTRQISNMVVIEVKMLSGFIPVKSTVRQLEKDKVIKRSDIQMDKVTLYIDQLDHQQKDIFFMVVQDTEVKDLKPATVEVYDYYETELMICYCDDVNVTALEPIDPPEIIYMSYFADDRAAADYNHPCDNATVNPKTNNWIQWTPGWVMSWYLVKH